MTLFSFIKEKFAKRSEEDQATQQRLREIQAEADKAEQIEYERIYRKNLNRLAILKARKEAKEKSGLAKFRAMQRANALQQKQGLPTYRTAIQKFSEYTMRNKERTAQRMALNKKRLETAKQMKNDRLQKSNNLRNFRKQQSDLKKMNRLNKINERKSFS